MSEAPPRAATAAMCNNGFAQDYGAMCARLGTERANLLYRAFDAGVDTVERLIGEEGIDCDFQRTGKLKLAAKPAHYDKLARSQELMAREVDPDTHMVSKAALPERDRVGRLLRRAGVRQEREHAHGQVCRGAGERGRAQAACASTRTRR